MALSFVTSSASASSLGIGPNGSPLKSMSRPDAITSYPASARRRQTSTIPSSKNCASSTATTSVVSSTFPRSSSLVETASAVWDAVVGPYLGVFRAGVDGVLEDLCAAVSVEGPAYAPDQLLRLAGEHRSRNDDERPGSLGRRVYRWIEDLRHGAYSTLRVAVHRVCFASAGSVWACGVPSCT